MNLYSPFKTIHFSGRTVLIGLMAGAFLMAGCQQPSDKKTDFSDALALLNAAWEQQDEQTKPAIFGGVGQSAVPDMPQALDFKDKGPIETALNVSPKLIEASSNGASMMNGMMANSFTASAWQIKDAASMNELAEESAETLKSVQWMCSFPETYDIIQCGNFLVIAYGLNDQVDPFLDGLKQAAPDQKVLESGSFE